jgi:high-affinity iron transporter
MLQAFIIVLREGFEAFLIVAVIAAYLKKTGRAALLPAVGWGIGGALAASAGLGFVLHFTANAPLAEGIMGLISGVLVGAFVVHMWRTASHLKSDMENKLSESLAKPTTRGAWIGVFVFTLFMIAREGMETALMLIQVHSTDVVTGSLLGALAAASISFLWTKVGSRINLQLFFQVTSLFLLLFVGQILLYSFHEFTEAGIFPNSEYWHVATEPYSPDGMYGKWISLATVAVCAGWMIVAAFKGKPGTKPVREV